jgi:tRNA dimethylallyltransferase
MTEKINSLMIIGQTCSGKESLSLQLAEFLQTDIISMDSMKIYREMNIGTAKATLEARQKIKHHMVDIINPNEDYNVSRYVENATELAKQLKDEKKLPLFSGGTSLYAKGLISGLFQLPEIPQEIKLKFENEYDMDRDKTYHKLLQIDPIACQKIFKNDRQRVTRALEVFEATHKPISSFQNQFSTVSDVFNFYIIGLLWPRNKLHLRIQQRVKWMMEVGLLEEAKNIYKKFPSLGFGARKAIGYYEFTPYFEGKCTLDEVIERITINTRQLCKHQMTWMKKLQVDWIEIKEDTTKDEIFNSALNKIQSSFLKSHLS